MIEEPLTDAEIEGALDILPARYRETVRAILLLCRALQRAEKALREIAGLPYEWANVTSGQARQAIEIARAALPGEEGRDG